MSNEEIRLKFFAAAKNLTLKQAEATLTSDEGNDLQQTLLVNEANDTADRLFAAYIEIIAREIQ